MRNALQMLGLALTVTALVLSAAPSVAPAKTQPTCKRPKSKTVAENRVARVFTRPLGRGAGLELVGCWKNHGRAFSLTPDDELCATRRSFDLVRLRGRFAAFYAETRREAGCNDEGAISPSVHVFNLRTAQDSDIWIPARPAGDRLLLNARGAVAWPSWLPNNQVDVIYDAEDRDHEYGARVLRIADTGAIHPESLRLTSDGRLDWINDGMPRSRQLAPIAF